MGAEVGTDDRRLLVPNSPSKNHVTHQICSNTLTVVSLARAVTRLTTSTRMEDRRKRDTISKEHCCTEGHPAWKNYCRKRCQAAPEPSPICLGSEED